jgi:hypothetical protein
MESFPNTAQWICQNVIEMYYKDADSELINNYEILDIKRYFTAIKDYRCLKKLRGNGHFTSP